MTKIPSMQKLLEAGSAWEVLDTDNFKVRTPEGNVTVPSTLLEAEHPYFAAVLREMLTYGKEVAGHLDGSVVYFTHELLVYGSVDVVDTDDVPKTIVDISEPISYSALAETITLDCVVLEVKNTEIDGQIFPFAIYESWQRIKVAKDELSKTYPGWENRLLAGKDLGLRERELMHYMFNVKPDLDNKLDINNVVFN